MNNEKQENERLQHELRQIVDKYSILLQKLLERCDQLVKERDQLVKERDQLVKERDQLVKERDQPQKECDELVKERDQPQKECDEIVKENQRLHKKECYKKQTTTIYKCSPAMATCDGLYDPPM
jgi:uncharacterized coiled-coil DUF342 family protein